jgi:hypothetical protein
LVFFIVGGAALVLVIPAAMTILLAIGIVRLLVKACAASSVFGSFSVFGSCSSEESVDEKAYEVCVSELDMYTPENKVPSEHPLSQPLEHRPGQTSIRQVRDEPPEPRLTNCQKLESLETRSREGLSHTQAVDRLKYLQTEAEAFSMLLWINGYDTAGFTHVCNTRSDVVMSLWSLVQSLDTGSKHHLLKQTPYLPQEHPTMQVKYATDSQGITVRSATDHCQGCRWAALKATCIVDNCTPDEMLEFLCNGESVPEYDSMMEKRGCTLVETQDAEWLFGGKNGKQEEDEPRNAEIRRCCFKPVWPTDPRDFCILSSWSKHRADGSEPAAANSRVWDKAAGSYPLERPTDFEKLAPGSYVIASRSIEHTKMPKQKGFVRGFLISSGWVIKLVPGCPDKCHIGVHALSDPGSSEILAPIINAVAVKAPVACLKNVIRIAQEAYAQGRKINELPSNPQSSQ